MSSSFLIIESERQSEQGFNSRYLQLRNAYTVINRQKAWWNYLFIFNSQISFFYLWNLES